ncbi:50S ribosomal protein L17 [Saccharicrinis sp. FJH65]|uniref:50S ribosomal protein L17 n=1 Tax=Saccharicrinis sp. FJH65 TaxID=3344659 RepID=UPI003F68BB2A
MRHRKKFNHLGRTTSHRKAMLSNMAVSLIKHKRIHTTLAKAKALKVFIEPIITKSKNDTTHSRRTAFSYLKDKEAVAILFREVSEKVAQRPGGYTRILKTGNRIGDNAEMCFIELVDFNENMLESTSTKKSSRRRRSSSKKKAEAAPAADVKAKAEVKEEVKEDVVEEKEVAAAEPEVKSKEEVKEPEAQADGTSEDASENEEEKKEE